MSSTTRPRPASEMMHSIIGAFLFTWFGTGALMSLVSSDDPTDHPLLVVILLFACAGLVACSRNLVVRWKRGERIALRPSGPVLATLELVCGLPLLAGAAVLAIRHEPIDQGDLIGLGGGLVLVASGVVGFVALARR